MLEKFAVFSFIQAAQSIDEWRTRARPRGGEGYLPLLMKNSSKNVIPFFFLLFFSEQNAHLG